MGTDNGDKLNPEEKKPETDEQKPQMPPKPEEPPKDYKIAEIWIKDNQLILDASPEFWLDKLRAVGVLDRCTDIIKYNNPYDKKKSSIITPHQHNMMNYARNIFKRKK